MATLDSLNKKIEELKEALLQSSESNISEKERLEAQKVIIEECQRAIDNEALMVSYDFSNAIRLLELYDFSIENLARIISDIQSVLSVREELNISSSDMPLEENQVSTFRIFTDKLNEVKAEINNKISSLSNKEKDRARIDNLEALRDILSGKGRRKYYTEDMFKDFCEVFDILNLPPEEALVLLEGFEQTKNLSSRVRTERVDIENVIALYREFLPPALMGAVNSLINRYKDEISYEIDLDNTREILQFLKDENILNHFGAKSILSITVYGKLDYIKEVIYPEVMSNTPNSIESYYEDEMTSVWVVEKGTRTHKRSSHRRARGNREVNEDKSLYSFCHKTNIDEVKENVELLKANRDLFGETFDPDDLGANLCLRSMPNWVLKKNIKLARLFNLNAISSLPVSLFSNGDIEDKISLAIELGLLNSPMTSEFRNMDKDIIKNEEFQRNMAKKRIYNQSIRNYFLRYSSMIPRYNNNEYAYLFYLLNTKGYDEFYNEFFSDRHAGKGNPELISPQVEVMFEDEQRMNDFFATNFMTDWYSDYIPDFDVYEDTIAEYTNEEKDANFEEQPYIDDQIFEDPLIKKLEENNTIMDTVTQNDEIVEHKNEFIYMFDNRIISRYKVLHNASILKNIYGELTGEMLMTCIVRNSYLDKDTFNKIYSKVMERGVAI